MKEAYFRRDIEGLRALAVILVLVFHAGLPLRGGFVGVDVFFVLSGFLITGLLLREAEETGRISFAHFYGRRAKRLLPAACLVVLATLVALVGWGPKADRALFAGDGVAVAGYVANWRFAFRAVEYSADDVGRSPFLHFWSLAVEEQFYFLWPFLVVVSLWVARRRGLDPRRTALVTLGFVFVPSLAWSVVSSTPGNAGAFFSTATRLWEMALGAAAAIVTPRLSALPSGIHRGFSLGGLLLVVGCAVFLPKDLLWPSFWALLPTVGAALLLVGGTHDPEGPLTRLLATRPLVTIGGLSYSLYLWHWPLVVLGQDWLGLDGVGWGSALTALSVLPAVASYRLLERPLRGWRALNESPGLSISLGVNLSFASALGGLAVVLVSGGFVTQDSRPSIRLDVLAGELRATPANWGAGALSTSRRALEVPATEATSLAPPPEAARRDLTLGHARGCLAPSEVAEPVWCVAGDESSERRAVLLGDSKSVQYFDALDEIFRAEGFRLETATKSACPYTEARIVRKGHEYENCMKANRAVTQAVLASPPELVVLSQDEYRGTVDGKPKKASRGEAVRGSRRALEKLVQRGIRVVVFPDIPNVRRSGPSESAAECVTALPTRLAECALPKAEAYVGSGREDLLKAVQGLSGVTVVDLDDLLCGDLWCPAVIGNVLVYRDKSHLTNTYARSMAPELQRRLAPLLRRSD